MISVTQTLAVRIVPVNNPLKANEVTNEPMGFYRAYVTSIENDNNVLSLAEHEVMRGIVPATVGYGSSKVPVSAVHLALNDYADKFGPLATTEDN